MRLSVLTPSYNYARFLSDALASVRHQSTSLEVEHVVMDGASTDETVDLLQSHEPPILWRSEPDAGQSDALNKALASATGEWIGWLNADEFYLPGAFRALEDALRRHPEADLVHGDAAFVDEHGRLLRLVGQHRPSSRVLRWYGPYISSCAMFVRRSAIPERGWDGQLATVMDWDLYLEVFAESRKIAYVPEALGAFRVHGEQVTAEPLPQSSAEFGIIASRHDLPRPGSRARQAAGVAGRLEHRVLKLFTGAAQRELAFTRQRGLDMRWFASENAAAAVGALIGKAAA